MSGKQKVNTLQNASINRLRVENVSRKILKFKI